MTSLWNALRTRAVLVTVASSGLPLFFTLPTQWPVTSRLLIVWCFIAAFYLGFVFFMMARSSIDDIKIRAPRYDQGKIATLCLSVMAASASVVAIVLELGSARGVGKLGAFHVTLAVTTVILSWTFVHTMFAIHYAHDFYVPRGDGHKPGLIFPGTHEPHYVDFTYFSFVIGCACATADVDIASREIRLIAMLHGIIAFVFNTAIVALTINLAAGLLGGA